MTDPVPTPGVAAAVADLSPTIKDTLAAVLSMGAVAVPGLSVAVPLINDAISIALDYVTGTTDPVATQAAFAAACARHDAGIMAWQQAEKTIPAPDAVPPA